MEQNKKADKLLEVRDLQVSFFTPAGEVKAVNGISYDVNYNEVMGVVGESGSGKSVEAYSIIGLLQNPGKVIGGSITFEGQDVLAKTPAEMVNFRGNEVAMIFQNPMTCLNPVYTIGNQLVEALKDISRKMTGKNNVDVVNAETRLIPQIPPMIDTPRQAFFKEKKRIPWREAKGKIAAEALIPYPPGIPLVNPGELVTEEIWEYMEEYRKKGLHFHGLSDASLDSFCVL